MAQQQEKKNDGTARRFRAAWDAGQLDEAAKLLRFLANGLTDRYGLLTEERAAKLALKPTKALKQFLALCEDEETVTILLTLPLALAQSHPTLALDMSRLLAAIPHFSPLTETLVKLGALQSLADFLCALPSLLDRVTKPPYDDASLSIAGNLIRAASVLHKSQAGFYKELLRAGVLDALLASAPFRNGRPDFCHSQRLGTSTLTFVSAAVRLCTDLCVARRMRKRKGIELRTKIVDWSQNLLELACAVLEAPGDEDQLANLSQNCVVGVLGLLRLVGEGFPGAFDIRPSIRRAAPHLERFPGELRSLVEGLERVSKADAAGGKPGSAEIRFLNRTHSPRLGFLTFRLMRKAFASSYANVQNRAIAELATFFNERDDDPDYRQANLHKRKSLFPLVPQILGLLEARSHANIESAGNLISTTLYVLSELIKAELARVDKQSDTPLKAEQLKRAAVRLLTWLKVNHESVRGRFPFCMGLFAIGLCARATWASLASVLNGGGFLVFCKDWFEANAPRLTLKETDDFADCLMTPLRVPRGLRVAQTAVREALTKDGVLTWVFEVASRAAGFKVDKHPDLLHVLVLCSELKIDVSAFITPELLRRFVRQLVHNWRGCRGVTLPTFEEDDVMLRSMGEEFNRLAAHVRIVETVLCGSRRDAGGNWDPGYLADPRAAVSEGIHTPSTATFMTFCEAEGVAVFASIVEERERLERFRARAEREGFLLPEAADVARRVGAVWELVASAFNLHECSNQACPRVEVQKGTFLMCGGCKSARYCGQGCQLADWKAGHKRECRTRAKVRDY